MNAFGASENRIVEIPVARIFIPATGFDDNDTVQAVMDGELPNVCYILEKQSLTLDPATHQIYVRQFATRLTSGSCKEGSEPGTPEFVTPIPYTETVDIGKLPEGSYNLVFATGEGQVASKPFEVSSAPVPTLDSLPYAMVTEVSVDDVVVRGRPISVTIKGILNNSCYSLNEEIKTHKVDDVTIVLPTITVARQDACLMYTRPFYQTITLDPVTDVARHLVHVRSMNGKSLNRVYGVKKQEN